MFNWNYLEQYKPQLQFLQLYETQLVFEHVIHGFSFAEVLHGSVALYLFNATSFSFFNIGISILYGRQIHKKNNGHSGLWSQCNWDNECLLGEIYGLSNCFGKHS